MDNNKTTGYSRRRFLKSGSALVAGGVIGGVAADAAFSKSKPSADAAPPLPWKWVQLDPLEAGRRAYHIYLEVGG